MANTRPFTYNNGGSISGTNQIGDLAYGDKNPVNGGPNYDNNPGGKKWWMGPNEDNRYIIGKDVPTMDHPTSTPEGNIGSVRFWGTANQTDEQFLFWVNRIPGTQGLPAFTDPNDAYNWLVDNGYFTNFLPSLSVFSQYYIYDRPGTNSSLSHSLIYSNTQNRLFIQPRDGRTEDGDQYFANFQIYNFSSTLINGNTYYYSGSAYSGSTTTTWLEAPIIQPSGIPDRDSTRTVGPMAINSAGTRLFVQSINNSSYSGTEERGLIQYDITQNPPTVITKDYKTITAVRNATPRTVDYENTSQMLFFTWRDNGSEIVADVIYVDDVNEEFVTTGSLKNTSNVTVDKMTSITPGPSNIVLGIKEGFTPRYFIYDMSGNNPTLAISQSSLSDNTSYPTNGTENDWYNVPAIYVPGKNAWFFAYRARDRFDNSSLPRPNRILKIENSHPYSASDFSTYFPKTGSAVNAIKGPKFIVYDNNRNTFWTTDVKGNLVGVDADTGEDKYDTKIEINCPILDGGTFPNKGAFIKDNKLVLIRKDDSDVKRIITIDLNNLIPN